MNKQTAAAAALEAKAAELGPGGKLPTFRDLQKELGISRTTLSTVLDSLESRGILSRRHGVGIFASSHLNHRSVVLLADPVYFRSGADSDPFWALLLEEARKRAEEASESLSVQFVSPACGEGLRIPPSLLADMEQGRVDGMIGVGLPPFEIEWIQARDFPFAAFASMGRCTASFDTQKVLEFAVEELAKRGCQRLELWKVDRVEKDIISGDLGQGDAFQEELKRRGLPPGKVRTETWRDWNSRPYPEPLSISLGAQLAEQALADGPMADGVVIIEDTVARGALPALMRKGCLAGRDFLMATHSNRGSSLLSGFEDMVIRIECDPTQLAQELFRMLEIQMEGGKGWTEDVFILPSVAASP